MEEGMPAERPPEQPAPETAPVTVAPEPEPEETRTLGDIANGSAAAGQTGARAQRQEPPPPRDGPYTYLAALRRRLSERAGWREQRSDRRTAVATPDSDQQPSAPPNERGEVTPTSAARPQPRALRRGRHASRMSLRRRRRAQR